MLLDFEVRSCSRTCEQTGKTLEPGEVYFSVLKVQESVTRRQDYSAEVWQGAPDDCLGWWRSRVPVKNEQPKLAPSDVMLNLFSALGDKPQETQFRYLLGLLLIRRRILRREDSVLNDAEQEVLTVFAPRRDEHFEMVVDEPNAEQAQQIQQRMIDLLYGDADLSTSHLDPGSDAA